jgi:hypothetical protein
VCVRAHTKLKKSNDTRHDLHSTSLRTSVRVACARSDELRAKRRRGSHSSMCVASAWLWQTLKGLARSYFSKSRAGAVLDSDSNIGAAYTRRPNTLYIPIYRVLPSPLRFKLPSCSAVRAGGQGPAHAGSLPQCQPPASARRHR